MNPPLEDPTLRWLIGGMLAALGAIFVWIYYHSVRDAKRESKLDDLSQEVGHATVHGSILERLHRYGGWIRELRRKMGLGDPPP